MRRATRFRTHFTTLPVASDEEHVDRELHFEGVDRVRGRDRQYRPSGEFGTAEQTPTPGAGVERRLNSRGQDDTAGGVQETVRRVRAAEEGLEKMRLRHRRGADSPARRKLA